MLNRESELLVSDAVPQLAELAGDADPVRSAGRSHRSRSSRLGEFDDNRRREARDPGTSDARPRCRE